MNLARAAFLAALPIVAVGCQLPPDVQPFADATIQLRASAVTSGRVINDDLTHATEHVGDSEADAAKQKEVKERAKQALANFQEAWKARNRALSAMVDYSNALVDITSASNDSSATIDNLATAVTNLSDGIGIPLNAASETGAVITDTVKFITAQVEAVIAQRALDKAMHKAQPIVDRLAQKLVEDFESMRGLAQDCAGLQRNELARKYSDFDGYWNHLQAGVLAFDASSSDAAALDHAAKLGQLLSDAEPRKQERDAAYAAAEARIATQLDLLTAASAACEAWAHTHSQIASAVKDKKRVNVQALISASNEMKELIGRARAL